MMEIRSMRYHGPGWTAEGDERRYLLWAPQDGEFATGSSSRPPRDHWAACYQDDDGLDGGFERGPTAESVLAIFPPAVRAAFKVATAERRRNG